MEQSSSKPRRVNADTSISPMTFWLALGAAVGGSTLFAYVVYVVAVQFVPWQATLEKHFAAIIGLPCAAIVAFAIVVFLRQTEGPIEFEAVGFKFKGASGQVAMWIACFLAIALAIWLLWDAGGQARG